MSEVMLEYWKEYAVPITWLFLYEFNAGLKRVQKYMEVCEFNSVITSNPEHD